MGVATVAFNLLCRAQLRGGFWALGAHRKLVLAVEAFDVSKEGDTLIDTKTERSTGVLGRA